MRIFARDVLHGFAISLRTEVRQDSVESDMGIERDKRKWRLQPYLSSYNTAVLKIGG